MQTKIKVIVADDHPLFLAGISNFLKGIPFVKEVVKVSDGDEVLPILKQSKYDVVFMDIRMKRMQGDEATRIIKKQFPHVSVIAISQFDDDSTVNQMRLAGCDGYILKNADEEELIFALKQVLSGKTYFDFRIAKKIIEFKKEEKQNLTPAEIRHIQMICEGNTNQEVADEFDIELRTSENRRNILYKKIGVKNTAGLISYAVFVEPLIINSFRRSGNSGATKYTVTSETP